MSLQSISVLQLNQYIKRVIDYEEFFDGLSVFGEVSNFKISNGNAYFDLKEQSAAISCMMFGDDVVKLENGKQVVLFGRVSFYTKYGKISFIAKKVEQLGKGALYEQYLILKEKLQNEGLFNVEIKKPIPTYSKKIGLITSETGAVLHDIKRTAYKKNPKINFVLYSVKVQGFGAEYSIVDGLNYFSNSDVDLIILARGGGSFEDLAPFNTEMVARAIYACEKPVISAVGHETDFSISDFVADLRCSTPTMASEVAVFDWYKTTQNLNNSLKLIDNLFDKIVSNNYNLLCNRVNLINTHMQDCIQSKKTDFTDKVNKFIQKVEAKRKDRLIGFDLISLKIEKNSPIAILKRGFVSVEKKEERINSLNCLDIGDDVKLEFFDGFANAKILGKEFKK